MAGEATHDAGCLEVAAVDDDVGSFDRANLG
jgi:hypothetical protein